MSMRMGIGREERLEAKLRSVGNVIRKGLLRDAAEFREERAITEVVQEYRKSAGE